METKRPTAPSKTIGIGITHFGETQNSTVMAQDLFNLDLQGTRTKGMPTNHMGIPTTTTHKRTIRARYTHLEKLNNIGMSIYRGNDYEGIEGIWMDYRRGMNKSDLSCANASIGQMNLFKIL